MSAETALVEILGGHGRVLSRERVALAADTRSFTIGRSVQADITLDDAHAAALHASVDIGLDGKILVTDLGTINGVVVGGKRHQGDGKATGLEVPGGLLQIGHTQLRIRSGLETLAAEKPDLSRPASTLRDPAWIAGFGALACGLQLAYSGWLGAPRDLASVIVTTMISGVLAAGAWVAFWALLSRVMQGEWRWLRHAAIFLGVASIFVAFSALLDLLWFMFSLPQWNTRPVLAGAIAFACALYLHLTHASSLSARRATVIACVIPALSAGTGYWVESRQQMRNVNYIGASVRIYPPALRLTRAGAADEYFQRAAQLRDNADKLRKDVRTEDDSDDAADDE